jgi:hypothetical protein
VSVSVSVSVSVCVSVVSVSLCVNPKWHLQGHHFVEPPPPDMPPWFYELSPEQQATVGGKLGTPTLLSATHFLIQIRKVLVWSRARRDGFGRFRRRPGAAQGARALGAGQHTGGS